MGQGQSTNLAILSIEHEKVRKQDLDVLINDFALAVTRKATFN